MRLPALLLLAACGGSAAPSTKSTTAIPTPSGEEDWRGYLAQIAGPTCPWVPGASFVACTPGSVTTLIGWEPTNRRYIAVRVSPEVAPTVMPGTASNAGWSFEGSDGRIVFTRAAKGWTANGLAASDVEIAIDPKPAAPAAVPQGNAPATENWRNELQRLVGTWSFNGETNGKPIQYVETCEWVPTTTLVACRNPSLQAWAIVAWEPHNRRYAMYGVDTSGAPTVAAGTLANHSWTFTGATVTTLTRQSPLEYKLHIEAGGKVILDGSYTTKPVE